MDVSKFPQRDSGDLYNPSYAYADDAQYAYFTPSRNTTANSYWYNFDFQIPAGATINGVTISCECHTSTSDVSLTVHLRAYKGTTAMGTDKTKSYAGTTDYVLSSTTTGTWTAAELNGNTSSGFNINLGIQRGSSYTSSTCYVDYVKAVVSYTEASANVNGTVTVTATQSVSSGGIKGGKTAVSSVGTGGAIGSAKKATSGGAAAASSGGSLVSAAKSIRQSCAIGATGTINTGGAKGAKSIVLIEHNEVVLIEANKQSTAELNAYALASVLMGGTKSAREALSVLSTALGSTDGRKGAMSGITVIATNSTAADGEKHISAECIIVDSSNGADAQGMKSVFSALTYESGVEVLIDALKAMGASIEIVSDDVFEVIGELARDIATRYKLTVNRETRGTSIQIPNKGEYKSREDYALHDGNRTIYDREAERWKSGHTKTTQ